MRAIFCPHGIKPKSNCKQCKKERKQTEEYHQYQKEYMKNYHGENREEEQKYRQENREKIKERTYNWREENRDRFNLYQREWKQKHPIKDITQKRKIRSRSERNFPMANNCELCPEDDKRTDNLQRHHPSYEDGMEEIFVTCCKSCHWYADRTTKEIIEGMMLVKRVDA